MTAATALVSSAVMASPAVADPGCTVTALSPAKVVIGTQATKTVTLTVENTCDSPVSWWAEFRLPDQQTPYGQPMLTNFKQDPSSRFTYIPGGVYTWGPLVNASAGARVVVITSFIGDDDSSSDNELPQVQMPFNLERRTTFGSTFHTSRQRAHRGQTVKISAALTAANWETHAYDGQSGTVDLQFRAKGAKHFTVVKQVQDDGTTATTRVKVHKTGEWRYHYAGTDSFGASYSHAVTVVVKK
jgi:hypothetical protein